MKWLIATWVAYLPHNFLSRLVGKIAAWQHPRFFVRMSMWFMIKFFTIDMKDVQVPDGGFQSLDHLFTRTLKPNARRIDPHVHSIVSPTDGKMGFWGPITDKTAIQAKGITYSIERLLDSSSDAEHFTNGFFYTVYLAPHNYHRIHSPLSGTVVKSVHIPGGLLPVFKESTEKHPELFIRNERVISYIKTKNHGFVAVVKIGATAVGKITLSYDNSIISNQTKTNRSEKEYQNDITITKGDELGIFHLGSTVVVLFQEKTVIPEDIAVGDIVHMGQVIGHLLNDKNT